MAIIDAHFPAQGEGGFAAPLQLEDPSIKEAPENVSAGQGFLGAGAEGALNGSEGATLKGPLGAVTFGFTGGEFSAKAAEENPALSGVARGLEESARGKDEVLLGQGKSIATCYPFPEEARFQGRLPFPNRTHFKNEPGVTVTREATFQGNLLPETVTKGVVLRGEGKLDVLAPLTFRLVVEEMPPDSGNPAGAFAGQAGPWEELRPEANILRAGPGEFKTERLEAVAASLAVPIKELFIRHLNEGVTVLRLGLTPPHLGEITLHLRYQKSRGSLAVEVHASSDLAGRLLSTSLPYLQEQLAQHNLRLESFTVTVGQEGFNSQPGEGEGGGAANRLPHTIPAAGGPGAGEAKPRESVPASLLVDRLV